MPIQLYLYLHFALSVHNDNYEDKRILNISLLAKVKEKKDALENNTK